MAGRKIGKIISAPKKKRHSLFLFAGLSGIIFILLIFADFFLFSPPEKPQPVRIPMPPPLPPGRVVSGKIAKGDTLSSALRSQNLSSDLVEAIYRHLKPLVNLRQVKPGDSFELSFTSEGKFLNFSYQANPVDIYQLSLGPSGEWVAKKREVMVEKYWSRVCGEITSSLFETMDALGEQDQLVLDFAEIFSWEIDFNSEPQPGDRVQMVVEKYYVGGTFFKYGRILYAEYQSTSRLHQAIYFQPSGGRGDYYNPQGQSLRKAFLRSPLQFSRVSSRYAKSRRHPVLGGSRPHYGVDYAAPVGSPVWAIADGTVSFCGWNGGYGNQVLIKHAKGYQSMYGHLSRFAPGMKRGKPVHQKQTIGYVGSTGLSTGPHLDFRLLKNNTFRNPLREISPRSAPLTQEQIPQFKAATDPVTRWVQNPSNPKYEKVASLTSKDLEQQK